MALWRAVKAQHAVWVLRWAVLAALEALGRIVAWRARRRPAVEPRDGEAHPGAAHERAEGRRRAPQARVFTVFTAVFLAAGVAGTAAFPQVFPLHRTVTGQNWQSPCTLTPFPQKPPKKSPWMQWQSLPQRMHPW